MNLQRSELFLGDVERQLRNYADEYQLDEMDVLKLCSRFNDALDETVRLICLNPEIGRRRLREYAAVANARSKALPKPFERFRIFYYLERQTIFLDRLIEGHTRHASDRD